MLLDKTDAFMTYQEFLSLLDYSASVPTGTTEGKRWRRRTPYMDGPGPHYWMMGEYGKPEGDRVPIIWRDIFIVQQEGLYDD
jgi:hypothetical protein